MGRPFDNHTLSHSRRPPQDTRSFKDAGRSLFLSRSWQSLYSIYTRARGCDKGYNQATTDLLLEGVDGKGAGDFAIPGFFSHSCRSSAKILGDLESPSNILPEHGKASSCSKGCLCSDVAIARDHTERDRRQNRLCVRPHPQFL